MTGTKEECTLLKGHLFEVKKVVLFEGEGESREGRVPGSKLHQSLTSIEHWQRLRGEELLERAAVLTAGHYSSSRRLWSVRPALSLLHPHQEMPCILPAPTTV